MSITVAIMAKPCHYCGSYHSTICPRVEEIEYHQDGSVKRVRLRGPDTPDNRQRFEFDTSEIPPDATVTAATLRLTPDTPADSQEDKT